MLKKFLSNLSLRVKTIIAVIILIIAIVFVFTFVYINYQKTVLQSKLEKLGLIQVRNLAFNSELGVFTKNFETLRSLIEGVLHEEDVKYVAIFNSNRQLLAYNERDKKGEKFTFQDEAVKRVTFSSTPTINYYEHLGREICQIAAPVELLRRDEWIRGGLISLPETGSGIIGEAVIGLSLDSLYDNLNQIKWLALKISYLIIFIASVITFFFVSLLTRPIKRLMEATYEVSKGNLDIQLKTASSDEVGRLTTSFNRMVREIKESRDKIEQAAKELARLNNEQEELLHIVSHDLRSPLINIQGFTQRLEPLFKNTVAIIDEVTKKENVASEIKDKLREVKKEIEEKFPVSVKFITKGVDRMDSLLSSLLAVSRVGRKADPIQLNDLNQVLSDILLVFDHQLKAKGIDIIRRELPSVPCRRNEINQVFLNLISNAINYMKQVPPKIIEIGYSENPDDYQIFLRDTGIGIKEEDIDKIFKMFSRIGEVEVPGEGIGLAYVQKIIRSHKGKIWVESKKDVGSTFYFTLPKAAKGV